MTRCPHSTKPDPGFCSQCAGLVPTLITVHGRDLYEDGVPSGRQLDHERVITARKTQRRRRK